MQKPETVFRQNIVIPFLKTLPFTKFMTIQQVAIHGDPDLVLCIRGHYVELELKSQFGEVSALQRYKMDLTRKARGTALVASPQTWDAVKIKLLNIANGEHTYDD